MVSQSTKRIYQQKCDLIYRLFGLLSKLLASLKWNIFPKQPSDTPLHISNAFVLYYPAILNECLDLYAAILGSLLLDIG